ncbi:unnamed protein product [Ranitomeya imitator]|uniref:Uncharacterized protein n=1 Tax=Ranitomeya imitator TaxID=111125 RepID=A0ABN9KRA8_9NEOB|nr:unnamed protein product [Ranitomeya imitator]
MRKALHYFKKISSKVPLKGNVDLLQHLATIEAVGPRLGVPAEGVDILLRQALSANLVDTVNKRILKCLIPATELHPDTVIAAVSLFCTGKSTPSTRFLFIRWLISVFDLISCKDILSILYNFFFCFLPDDQLDGRRYRRSGFAALRSWSHSNSDRTAACSAQELRTSEGFTCYCKRYGKLLRTRSIKNRGGSACPILCHLLYLITKKEHVQAYRVRCLLELQSRKV